MSWLKSLVAAMIGGAVGAAAETYAAGGQHVKSAAITGAALTLAAYLKQSPRNDRRY